MMDPIGRLLHNIGMLFFAKGLNLLLSVVTVALIARYLGIELFGKYSFVVDFVFILLPIINFGLSQIIIRQIAQDKKDAGEDFFSVISIRLFLIILCSLTILLIVTNLNFDHQVKLSLYLAMVSEFLLTFVGLNSDIFVAYERMKYVPTLIITNKLLTLLATVSVIYFDWGLYGLFIVSIIINLLSIVIGFYITSTRFVSPRISFKSNRIKYFLKESYPVAIAGFLMELSFRMDSFFLAALKDFNEVAFFGAPLKVITRLLIITLALTEAMFPTFSRVSRSSATELLFIFEKTLKLLNIILLPVCIFFTLFAKELIMIIFGHKFIPGTTSMQLFMWVLLFFSTIILMGNVLILINKQKLLIFTMAIGICINGVFDIILIPLYGHVGASLGKVIAFGVMALIIFYFVVQELGMFSISETVLKPALSILPAAIVAYSLRDIKPVLGIVSGGLFYIAGLYVFRVFSSDELSRLKKTIERI